MICPVCSSSLNKIFNEEILNKYSVEYFKCNFCGLIKTEKPYWLDEAYSNAISISDTGLVARNILLSYRVSVLLYFLFGASGKYIDLSGGTGLFVRLMRDIGFDFYWEDPYCENIHAKGFDFIEDGKKYDLITAFEVLEHLEDPIAFINNSFLKSGSKSFVFTTEIFSEDIPPASWWYYSFNTGQHITFYQRKTLKKISEKFGLNLYSINGVHIMTERKISEVMLKFILGKANSILFRYVRKKTISLTNSDNLKILSSLSK